MPRTFLVKSFKKREGKSAADIGKCMLQDETTKYQSKKRILDSDVEFLQVKSKAVSNSTDSDDDKFKRGATRTGIFMPRIARTFKYEFDKQPAVECTLTNSNGWSQSTIPTDKNDTKQRENCYRVEQNSPQVDRNFSVRNYDLSRVDPLHRGTERMLTSECGREPIANSMDTKEAAPFPDNKNSNIKRPIALMPEKCHCKECQRDPKFAFYDRQHEFNGGLCIRRNSDSIHAKYARDFHVYDWHHTLRSQRGFESELEVNKGFFYHGHKMPYSLDIVNHDGRGIFKSLVKRDNMEKISQKSIRNIESDDSNTRVENGFQNQVENGGMYSKILVRPAERGCWEPINEDDNESKSPDRSGSEGTLNKFKNKRRISQISQDHDEMLKKEQKHLLDENNQDYELLKGRKNQKTDFKTDEANNTKPKLVSIKTEKDCMNDQDEINSKDHFKITENMEKSEFLKLKQNGIKKLNNINIKVENLIHEEKWCTEPDVDIPGRQPESDSKSLCKEYHRCTKPGADSSGSDYQRCTEPGFKSSGLDYQRCYESSANSPGSGYNNTEEQLSNIKMDRVEKLSTGKEKDRKKQKCEKRYRASPLYGQMKSELFIKSEDRKYDYFHRIRHGSNGEEYNDELKEEDSFEDVENEYEIRHQDFMLTSRVNRNARDNEKRALIRKLKEKEAGKKSRAVANWLERKRVAELNDAFELLRKIVPTYGNEDRTLSKIKTLRYASTYINHLAMICDKQCRYGSHDIKQGLVNLLEIDPLIQRCQEHLQTRSVI